MMLSIKEPQRGKGILLPSLKVIFYFYFMWFNSDTWLYCRPDVHRLSCTKIIKRPTWLCPHNNELAFLSSSKERDVPKSLSPYKADRTVKNAFCSPFICFKFFFVLFLSFFPMSNMCFNLFSYFSNCLKVKQLD